MYGHIDTYAATMPAWAVVTLYGHIVGGPYFDDLEVGQVFDSAPTMTLTAGAAAVHQSIIGDRLRLALDAELATAVTGSTASLAHPALVCDVAIGQTTLATQRVKANLFYRGLRFHRFPVIGDTLFTRTEVVGLKQNSAKPGRAPTGLAALRMTTVDQIGRLVLDFYRCAMLPLSADIETGRADDHQLATTGRKPPCRNSSLLSRPQPSQYSALPLMPTSIRTSPSRWLPCLVPAVPATPSAG